MHANFCRMPESASSSACSTQAIDSEAHSRNGLQDRAPPRREIVSIGWCGPGLESDLLLLGSAIDGPELERVAVRLECAGGLHVQRCPGPAHWTGVFDSASQTDFDDRFNALLERSACCAVLIGREGLRLPGRMRLLDALFCARRARGLDIIPVLLAGGTPDNEALRLTPLSELGWVDARRGLDGSESFVALLTRVLLGAGRSEHAAPNVDVPARPDPCIVHPLPVPDDLIERPEVKLLLKNWRAPRGPRVTAIVGMAGAGKTSLLSLFLAKLGLGQQMGRGQGSPSPTLPPLDGLFVWSFAEEPNVDHFVASLREYLYGRLPPLRFARPVTVQLVTDIRHQQPGRILLVLDGLETVQVDSDHNGAQYGALRDSALRYLLRSVAAGMGGMRALFTSRRPVPELRVLEGRGYSQIEADDLDAPAARQFLRSRKLRGGDAALAAAVARFGTHAMTLEHLARVINERLGGHTRCLSEWAGCAAEEGSPAWTRQAQRLRSVLCLRARSLPIDEQDVLEILSQLRPPVSLDFLFEICARQHRDLVETSGELWPEGPRAPSCAIEVCDMTSGLPWPADIETLTVLVKRLESRGYLTTRWEGGDLLSTVHPWVRATFRIPSDLYCARLHARAAHCIDARLGELADPLSEQGLPSSDRETMTYHLARARHPDGARPWQATSPGDYTRLGLRQCAYQRGLRLLAAAVGRGPSLVERRRLGLRLDALTHDQALYLMDLGRLDKAEALLRPFLKIWRSAADDPMVLAEDLQQLRKNRPAHFAHVAIENLCDALVLQGKLPESELLADRLIHGFRRPLPHLLPVSAPVLLNAEAIRPAEMALPKIVLPGAGPYARRALARSLQGKSESALADFAKAAYLRLHPEGEHPRDKTGGEARSTGRRASSVLGDPISSSPPSVGQTALHWAHLLVRLGRLKLAFEMARKTRSWAQRSHWPALTIACELVIADIARLRGELATARPFAERALQWAIETGHQETFCGAQLAHARIALGECDYVSAGYALDECLREAIDSGLRVYQIDALNTTGRVALGRGDARRALQSAELALELASDARCGYAWGTGNAFQLLGEICEAMREREAAISALSQAEEVRQRISDPKIANSHRAFERLGRSHGHAP